MKYSIDELKKEYIGKEFGWLTVLDVYPGGKNIGTMFTCICKCGNQIEIAKRKVISGHTASCGCYKQSKEYSSKLKCWYSEHPEECANRSIRCKAYFNRPDQRLKLSNSMKKRYESHPEIALNLIDASQKRCKQQRVSADYNELIQYIHPDYIDKLLSGNLKGSDLVSVKCKCCGQYGLRKLCNIFIFKKSEFRKKTPPVCQKCRNEFYSSKAEQEIEDFIKSFYRGTITRNTREIIPPLELDIYIPDKKIAIEFNGDYWHSDKFKDKEYHLNKYLQCKEAGILLVSIFEAEWNKNKDAIKEYLKDLFNDKENKLSFNEDHTLMNNNYPSPNVNFNSSIIEDYYQFNESKVFTCGYTLLN